MDCLVLAPKGFFLVELKHFHGRLEGNTSSWYREVSGRSWEERNPLLLTNHKAKMLQAVMKRQVGSKAKLPFISALVFLTNADQDVQLRDNFAMGVVGPAGADWVGKKKLPSIKQALTSLEVNTDGSRPRQYSPESLASGRRAFEKLGIKPSIGLRTVHDFVLGKKLDYGDIYQDYEAKHRRYEERKRRVRLFPHGQASTEDQRRSAARAAEREFTLFQGEVHPGIECPENFADHDLGPALIFPYEDSAVNLSQWLSQNVDRLTMDIRLRLFRDVAEALAYAHNNRIFHRSLGPQSVFVSGDVDNPSVKVRDWHEGVRAQLDNGETKLPTTMSSLASAVSANGDKTDCYRAPEMRNTVRPSPRPGDVFSLGALGYLIFSGHHAASSPGELDEHLLSFDGLSLDGVVDGVPETLRMLVWRATQKDPSDRYLAIEELLGELDEAERELKAETVSLQPEIVEVEPLDARKGDYLAERFEVRARLGKGASAVALLVADEEANGAERVLKISLSESHDSQLRDEADSLGNLHHNQIVRLISDPLVIGGRQALLLARAGKETLIQRLNADGPVGDFLERWGTDLLNAVAYLESMGIAHRDLKPANIGVAVQGKNKERHLVIFDFSLTKAPVSEITVGTTGFIDPFLRVDGRNRWDSHAERYSAAVVLYQMATNELPTWGVDHADPMMVDSEVNLDVARFDAGYAESLMGFFRKAFARDVADRFDSAEEMLVAWAKCFAESVKPKSAAKPVLEPEILVTRLTLLHELELSKRALSALSRAGLSTVDDLLEVNPVALNRMRGVGKKTVGEIRETIKQLKKKFDGPGGDDSTNGEMVLPNVDRLVSELMSKVETDQQQEVIELHLGLAEKSDGTLPNQTAVARSVGTNQAAVSQVLGPMRVAWAEIDSLEAVRALVASLLENRGGVATLDQLAKDLLARCGSTTSEPERTAKGRAAVRAVFDVEGSQPGTRWVVRRRGDVFIAALDPLNFESRSTADPDAVIAYALKLGERASSIAEKDPALTADGVIKGLRRVSAPDGFAPMSELHLVALAASMSESAAVSSRGELYTVEISVESAIKRSVGSLLGMDELKPKVLEDRVRARFPQMVAEFPTPDQVSDVLAELGLGYEWVPTDMVWRTKNRSTAFSSVTASSTVLTTLGEDDSFDERLAAARGNGRLLVMSTTMRKNRYRQAIDAFDKAGVTLIDVDRLVLNQLKAQAEAWEVDWQVVLDSDSASLGTEDATNLRSLVGEAVKLVEREIRDVKGTVLLHNLGLLARYEKLTMIERLRVHVQSEPGSTRSVWVLIPTEGGVNGPVVDGKPIGIVSPNEFVRVPFSWVESQGAAA